MKGNLPLDLDNNKQMDHEQLDDIGIDDGRTVIIKGAISYRSSRGKQHSDSIRLFVKRNFICNDLC